MILKGPMQTTLFFVISLALGIMLAIYMPMNSSVALHLGSTLAATITFFSVALITALIVFVCLGQYGALSKVDAVPSWLYLTGCLQRYNGFWNDLLDP